MLNKIDGLAEQKRKGLLAGDPVAEWQARVPDAIPLSARTGEGLDLLRDRVVELMRGPILEVQLEAPMSDSRLTDFLEKRTEVLDRAWSETTSMYTIRIGRRQVEQLLSRGSKFSLNGTPAPDALKELWPEPELTDAPAVPPHRRDWPEEQFE